MIASQYPLLQVNIFTFPGKAIKRPKPYARPLSIP